MELLDREEYKVARAVLFDAINHEGGVLVFSDERGAAVKIGDWYKCVFNSAADFKACAEIYGIKKNACVLGMPLEEVKKLGGEVDACKTFAYFNDLPPVVEGLDIKRLAHTLCGVVAENYVSHCYKLSEQEAAEIMKDKGVFGAFVDSSLAGFIGRHSDGSMGMLTVFDGYKRRGIGGKLEAFMINYVMTLGRVPFCDVYTDNDPSLALQQKLGMTEGAGYTFWLDELPFQVKDDLTKNRP
ncbi:MAG: GNAT family N-acetyltransferase [Clostridiales bacterium]|nr:GNAT family N-acetyltransferase [Clostridiales bacterium]